MNTTSSIYKGKLSGIEFPVSKAEIKSQLVQANGLLDAPEFVEYLERRSRTHNAIRRLYDLMPLVLDEWRTESLEDKAGRDGLAQVFLNAARNCSDFGLAEAQCGAVGQATEDTKLLDQILNTLYNENLILTSSSDSRFDELTRRAHILEDATGVRELQKTKLGKPFRTTASLFLAAVALCIGTTASGFSIGCVCAVICFVVARLVFETVSF